jgi:hypothetical protein
MSTTNFSIAEEPFIDFKTSGWPQDKREALSAALCELPGVSSVQYAGAGDTTRVRFDQKTTSREALMDAATSLANEILPGHNFGQD